MSSTNENILSAKRFLSVRKAQNFSQQQFADELGISLRSEQNYERGERKIPSDVITTVAKKFGVDPLWLLDGSKTNPESTVALHQINYELLNKSVSIVLETARELNIDPKTDKLSKTIVAVYQFYAENASGSGCEHLIRAMLTN